MTKDVKFKMNKQDYEIFQNIKDKHNFTNVKALNLMTLLLKSWDKQQGEIDE